MRLFFLLFTVLSLQVNTTFAQGVSSDSNPARAIVEKMLKTIDQTNSMTYTFKSWERFNGKMHYGRADVKLQEKPKKIYLKNYEKPVEGVEVLWVTGEYDGSAYVNPNMTLIPNLKLDPYGSRMRDKQHHTILESGFNYLAAIIRDAKKRAESLNAFDLVFKYQGEETFAGKACHKILLEDTTFQWVDYTVKAGEDLNKIARSRFISEYLILEKNKLKFYDSVKPGQVIKIPSSYATKTILYIDKATNLPIGQMMHDEQGMFEKYEFSNLRLNVTFKPDEFTPSFPGYNF